MNLRGRLLLALLALAPGVSPGDAAESAREVHGVAEAYAEPGVALAWAVLRGETEAATQIVVRIVADPTRYAVVQAQAINPFSQQQRSLLPATSTRAAIDIRAPRSQFADFPRCEIRFHASAAGSQPGAPELIVFYLGVPDTTPEFKTEAAMNSYLADRLARLGTAGGKAP